MGKTWNLAKVEGFEREVLLAKLVEDFTLYPRVKVDDAVIGKYREAMRAGAVFPLMVVDQQFRIIDGFHRYGAFKLEQAHKVKVIMRQVKSDAEFFELAIAANATHGNNLSGLDKSRIISRAEDLGIEKEKIASLLAVRLEKVEKVEKGWGRSEGGLVVPLKRSVQHLAGKHLTERQSEAHKTIGGMQQTFYINQVITLLEGNLLDHKNDAVLSRLYRLAQLLEKYNFKKMKAS